MTAPDFATPVDPDRAWMMGKHGPTCIPYRDMFGGSGGWPHHPGDYGRYVPIDVDANNRANVDAYCERHPERPRPVFGWGVCRHGFGLQCDVGSYRTRSEGMTADEAERTAIELNDMIVIGDN